MKQKQGSAVVPMGTPALPCFCFTMCSSNVKQKQGSAVVPMGTPDGKEEMYPLVVQESKRGGHRRSSHGLLEIEGSPGGEKVAEELVPVPDNEDEQAPLPLPADCEIPSRIF